MRSWRTWLVGGLLLAVLAYGGLSGLLRGYSPVQSLLFFRAPSPTQLTRDGQPIVDALVAYREAHGAFPESLDSVVPAQTATFFGPWRYSHSEERQSCTLSVGDYERYLFEVWWTESDGWYVDS